MNTKDGGAAFPRLHTWQANGDGSAANTGYEVTSAAPGMTLRDWFAGQALQAGILSSAASPATEATRAYEYADAMLAARDAKGQP